MRAAYATIVTVVLHGGVAAGIAMIDRDDPPPPPTVITVVQVPKKRPPPPPPPPAPPQVAPKAPVVRPRPAPAPPKPAPAPPVAAAAPTAPAAPRDFGVKLGGPSGNGPALPATPQAPTAAPAAPEHKELKAAPAAEACSDPIVKPKPIHVVQPGFTPAAQDANITGKVRVEITISATGEVTNARVIEGLGYGLDEAALDAARASTFQPATKCGQPVATTFTIGMRFTK